MQARTFIMFLSVITFWFSTKRVEALDFSMTNPGDREMQLHARNEVTLRFSGYKLPKSILKLPSSSSFPSKAPLEQEATIPVAEDRSRDMEAMHREMYEKATAKRQKKTKGEKKKERTKKKNY